MDPAQASDPFSISAFPKFQEIIAENIGFFPDISYDRSGSHGHRVQIFDEPAGAEIWYSERALARYKELFDLTNFAHQRNSATIFSACLSIILGGDLIRTNRISGLALMSSGFHALHLEKRSFQKAAYRKIIEYSVDGAHQNDVGAIINLLFPLAHEIGHLPQAQALGPKVIWGDEFHKTLKISYNQVRAFTGDFDYSDALGSPNSPLNLGTLREEATCDWFAATAMFYLILKLLPVSSEYPISIIFGNVLQFPLVMALETVLLRENSRRAIQEITLAMHCRYSILIDSVRSTPKFIFKDSPKRLDIDKMIDNLTDKTVEEFDNLYRLSWQGAMEFLRCSSEILKMTEAAVVEYVKKICSDARIQIAIGNHINTLLQESSYYPLSEHNQRVFQAIADQFMTFDTVIIDGDKTWLIR
jgi:hypothetical protein